MKIKTSELSGAALDWVVAKCGVSDMDNNGLFLGRTRTLYLQQLVTSKMGEEVDVPEELVNFSGG